MMPPLGFTGSIKSLKISINWISMLIPQLQVQRYPQP
nr:MAG TPA: hypothetical protein [Caudoviricetes sp.]